MKVLLLGIDGLRPDCILYANANNIKSLLKNSAYKFNSKITTKALSGPSWAAMFTGKTNNGIKNNKIVESNSFLFNKPTIFSKLENKGVKTKCILSNWKGIRGLTQHCKDQEFVKLKTPFLSDKYCIEKSLEYINKSIDNQFLFLYLESIDYMGHKHGFSIISQQYINHIEKIDRLLEQLILKSKKQGWQIIITTDHSGVKTIDIPKNYHKSTKKKGSHNIDIDIDIVKNTFQIYYGDTLNKKLNYKKGELLVPLTNNIIYDNILKLFNN